MPTVPAVIREADDRDTLLLGLVENVARENLSPDRGGARLRAAAGRVRALARRGLRAGRPLEAGDLEQDAAARAPRRRARDGRARRAPRRATPARCSRSPTRPSGGGSRARSSRRGCRCVPPSERRAGRARARSRARRRRSIRCSRGGSRTASDGSPGSRCGSPPGKVELAWDDEHDLEELAEALERLGTHRPRCRRRRRPPASRGAFVDATGGGSGRRGQRRAGVRAGVRRGDDPELLRAPSEVTGAAPRRSGLEPSTRRRHGSRPCRRVHHRVPRQQVHGEDRAGDQELVENGTIRIIDLLFVMKDADGTLTQPSRPRRRRGRRGLPRARRREPGALDHGDAEEVERRPAAEQLGAADRVRERLGGEARRRPPGGGRAS